MKKIKHSKFKNTGFIFELLVRQITAEVMSSSKSVAEKLLKEHFNSKQELSKELKLYQYLINEKYNSESKAEQFINTILEARKKIDEKKLTKEKYNLIKQIKETYDLDEFIKSPISNYKTLASIYKIFETVVTDTQYEPTDIVSARFTIAENIINSSIQNKEIKIKDAVLEEYRKQDDDLRAVSYKLLVESFNNKYKNLTEQQKGLLREYINNINNTGKLNEYVSNEVTNLVNSLKEIGGKISDKVTKIKLAETISNIRKIKSVKKIKEQHLSAMMMTYELLNELKQSLKK